MYIIAQPMLLGISFNKIMAPCASTPALLCSLQMGSDPAVPSQVSTNFPWMQSQQALEAARMVNTPQSWGHGVPAHPSSPPRASATFLPSFPSHSAHTGMG
uniref:Uncharacterized protein n=1 Tax=Zonotrichia albicollis TaxID=44394 RepID=A0A8D2MN10_ZONAL